MSDLCVAITTMNRTPLLERSLARLSELSIPDEILVIDDGGADGCETLCKRFSDQGLPVRYIYTHQPYRSLCSHARNVALRNTDCDLFGTMEPEMFLVTDAWAQFREYHERVPNDMVNAGTIYHEHPDWNPPQETVTKNWTATWVAMYERQWLLDIGGWDEFGFPDPWSFEDTDLVTRISATHGVSILLDVEARHMWHPIEHCRQDRNDAYFVSKSASGEMQLVANVGHDWGVIKPR